MDVKEKLINDILLKLDENFDIEQIQYVKKVLAISLNEVQVLQVANNKSNHLNESNLIKRYVLNRKIQGRTEATISLHVRTIKKFIKTVDKSIYEIETNDIRYFLLNRKEKDGLTNASVAREQYTISNFFRWLYSEALIAQDPTINLDLITVKTVRRGVFTSTEVEILRKCAKKEKEKLVIELLLCTGCRVSELVSLKLEDYNKDNGSFNVRGKKERVVFINAKSKIAIEDYLQKVPHTSGPLILGLKGKAMSVSGIQKMLRTIANKGNIKEVYPQKFRRTSAAFAYFHGMKLNDIRLFLGHSDINSTQRYIKQDVDSLRLAHDKYFY